MTMMRKPLKQKGVAVIELPLIALVLMVVMSGLVVVHKLLHLQSRLDRTAFSMVDASAVALVPPHTRMLYDQNSASDLLRMAQRVLADTLPKEKLGLVLEMRLAAEGSPVEVMSQRAGHDCDVRQPIESLGALAPISASPIASLKGRTADLFQVTLCVSAPFETDIPLVNWLLLALPLKMSSQAVMIGRNYHA
ncbi:tight adherence pilus pseudopilin TadF [Vibrio ostreicida]|uniref:Tight adherence pilus pseudopilin TadF n=1 Tax=Vibrio ostreicida TaxID=526588 RepID=A0ABT8BYP9_9VIBR|nr:tight adherence pilus pseudopilin TadF [Vibrio ostreicida]MDN3612287.1 tight adherence pilus pseudopilin TadF [Vibrio ostreicida]